MTNESVSISSRWCCCFSERLLLIGGIVLVFLLAGGAYAAYQSGVFGARTPILKEVSADKSSDGKCYKFEKAAERVNKKEAEAACKKIKGGQLIGEEALQNANIDKLITVLGSRATWTSLYDASETRVRFQENRPWKWQPSGNSFKESHSQWCANEPNNYQREEWCTAVAGGRGLTPCLDDRGCEEKWDPVTDKKMLAVCTVEVEC